MDDHKAITPVEAQPGRQLAPVVAQVLAANPTPEVLRELLQVQRDWEAGEARKSYSRALVALKRDLPASIKHNKTVDFTNKAGIRTFYTHTTLSAAMAAVQPVLTQHGFSLTWKAETGERLVTVTAMLAHEDGHSESCSLSSPPDNSGNKGPAQSIASTVTYLERYTALALLGIATSDMQEPHGPRAEEPVPEGAAEVVDKKANMELAGKLRRNGLLVTDAEDLVQASVTNWTALDCVKIRGWAKAQLDAREPSREPGQDQ